MNTAPAPNGGHGLSRWDAACRKSSARAPLRLHWVATGAVWDAAGFAAYTTDPAAYLKAALGDDGAKSKMSFKLDSSGEDVAAYLSSVSQ